MLHFALADLFEYCAFGLTFMQWTASGGGLRRIKKKNQTTFVHTPSPLHDHALHTLLFARLLTSMQSTLLHFLVWGTSSLRPW